MADFVELHIDAGSTFSTEVTVRDANGLVINLTNYTARAQLRKSYYSTTATDFTIEIPQPVTGILMISLTASNTANIKPGRYVYDVELQSNTGIVTRIFEGIATISPNVTK